MVDEKKIEEIRRKMRETAKDRKMYWEDEPDTVGCPENTIAPDEDDEEEQEDERRSDD
jgi:hypothetical protein